MRITKKQAEMLAKIRDRGFLALDYEHEHKDWKTAQILAKKGLIKFSGSRQHFGGGSTWTYEALEIEYH